MVNDLINVLNEEQSKMLADERKTADFAKLVSLGGPFTDASQIDMFVASKSISQEDKQNPLCTEVRYVRDTTLSLPKTSEIFRLREAYNHLPLERLPANLKVYLGKVSSNYSASWTDVKKAITSAIL